jgi:CBS-domain-containing membrane protein
MARELLRHAIQRLHWRTARIRNEFTRLWKNYICQSLLAAVVSFIVLLVLNMEHAVVIASIGATAFIVFTMPRNTTAHPRRIVGGHIIGLISGSLAALVPHHATISYDFIYALAIGISVFLMVALDFEHPPASGTALGAAITGFSYEVLTAVITSSILLALAHRYFRKYLRELT